MRIGTLALAPVGPGAIVVIPAGTPQQITNPGTTDLVFHCICTPRFTPGCYEALPEET
jgi:mannose-6-phosphate isomerase-like protein (cupin superfamily)